MGDRREPEVREAEQRKAEERRMNDWMTVFDRLEGLAIPSGRAVAASPSNQQAVSPLRASIPIARNDQ